MASTRDDRIFVVSDLPGLAAGGFDSFDNPQRFVISDLAKHDVLPIKPACHNGRDEKLGAVTRTESQSLHIILKLGGTSLRIGARIGH